MGIIVSSACFHAASRLLSPSQRGLNPLASEAAQCFVKDLVLSWCGISDEAAHGNCQLCPSKELIKFWVRLAFIGGRFLVDSSVVITITQELGLS